MTQSIIFDPPLPSNLKYPLAELFRLVEIRDGLVNELDFPLLVSNDFSFDCPNLFCPDLKSSSLEIRLFFHFFRFSLSLSLSLSLCSIFLLFGSVLSCHPNVYFDCNYCYNHYNRYIFLQNYIFILIFKHCFFMYFFHEYCFYIILFLYFINYVG